MRYFIDDEISYFVRVRKPYGFFHFLWDCFMVVITFGLWLIWIFIREMRNRY